MHLYTVFGTTLCLSEKGMQPVGDESEVTPLHGLTGKNLTSHIQTTSDPRVEERTDLVHSKVFISTSDSWIQGYLLAFFKTAIISTSSRSDSLTSCKGVLPSLSGACGSAPLPSKGSHEQQLKTFERTLPTRCLDLEIKVF